MSYTPPLCLQYGYRNAEWRKGREAQATPDGFGRPSRDRFWNRLLHDGLCDDDGNCGGSSDPFLLLPFKFGELFLSSRLTSI